MASALLGVACASEDPVLPPIENESPAETEPPADDSSLVGSGSPLERCHYDLSWSPPVELLPAFAVELRVHVPRSRLTSDALCAILEELNQIWWQQAGVCFETLVVQDDEASATQLDLWFESRSPFPNGVVANGVYVSPDEIFSLDRPGLATVEQPTRYSAARTAAHELGHALGLGHQNCGAECDELLMRSGTRGFRLAHGEPADTDEIQVVRDNLTRVSAGTHVTELARGTSCRSAALRGF